MALIKSSADIVRALEEGCGTLGTKEFGTMPTSGTVNAPAGLNLRAGPSTDASIVSKLPLGTKLDLLSGQGSDWLQVRMPASGLVGYVAAKYVTLTVDTPPVDPPSGFLILQPGLMNVPLEPARKIPPPSDGVGQTVARIWNTFGGLVDYLSTQLVIPASAVVGVLAAESGGRTGDANGRMIIRFENHIFWNYWGKTHADEFNKFFSFDQSAPTNAWKNHLWRPNEAASFAPFHGNQDLEYQVLNFARARADTSALLSISMGAPQIMGFNYQRLGYATVQDMFAAFSNSPRAQLIGIYRCPQIGRLPDFCQVV
jgi:hypothetical protein